MYCSFCHDTGTLKTRDFDGFVIVPCPVCADQYALYRRKLAREFGTDAERRRIRTWISANSVPMLPPRRPGA
jgi:hypothetical protein